MRLNILFLISFAFVGEKIYAKREFISDCVQNGRSIYLTCRTDSEREPFNYFTYMKAVCSSTKRNEIERLKLQYCQMTSLHSYYFLNEFSNAKEFDISSAQLKMLRSEDFSGAQQLQRLIATGNDLKEIPNRIFERASTLTNVELSRNQISRIDDLAFENVRSTLRLLNLSNNSLKYINNRMFRQLRGLVELYLSANYIEKIEPLSFAESHNLTWLDLSGNKIQTIELGTFDGLTNLRSLDLSDNLINRIDFIDRASAFTPIIHLSALYLHDNHIDNLQWLRSTELNYLMILDLGKNELSDIQHDFDGIAYGLKSLDLSNNEINVIQLDAFNNLNRLDQLNISYNAIDYLDPDTFNNCTNLKVLDVSGTGLRDSLKTILPDVEDVIV